MWPKFVYCVWGYAICLGASFILYALGLLAICVANILSPESIEDLMGSVGEFYLRIKYRAAFIMGLVLYSALCIRDGGLSPVWWIMAMVIAFAMLAGSYLSLIGIIGSEKQSHFIDGDEDC